MKKDNQTKSFSSEDYLAELRRNNMYGVKYYNDLENEFAEESLGQYDPSFPDAASEKKKKEAKSASSECKCAKSEKNKKTTK